MPHRLFSSPRAMALTLLVSLLLTQSGCALLGGAPPNMNQDMPVTLLTIEPSPITDSSQYLAKLESRQAILLKPQVSGRVSRILVEAGQPVRAGQVLIQLDAAEQSAAVASAQQAAASATSQVKQAEGLLVASKALRQSSVSNIDYTEKQLARTKTLAEKQAASQQDLERTTDIVNKAHNDLAINNGQIASQEKAVLSAAQKAKQAQSDLQQQQAKLAYYSIRAPFSGIVGDIPVKVGDVVMMGEGLAELANNQTLEINLTVPVEQAKNLRPGLPIRLVHADSRKEGEAVIYFVSPTVNHLNQTVLVKAKLPNTTGVFRADQLVNAYLVWKEIKGVVIPTSAVMHAAGLDFVFIATQGKDGKLTAKQRPVELGALQQFGYEVLGGLKPGEVIVSTGLQKLQDGMGIADLAKIPEPKEAGPASGTH